MAVGCSKCLPCRIKRRKLWAHRIMLESLKHGDSSFVTLTYNVDHLPKGGTLVPEHVQKWLKRLRKALEPQKIRFFLAGEYGDDSWRPHYHVVLFGVDPFTAGGEDGESGLVAKTWVDEKGQSMGYIYVGTLTLDSANYVAGYVTKKMTFREDPRLHGRYPEFARMSLRPGIGAAAMADVAKVVASEWGLDDVAARGDVPHTLLYGVRSLPLGRYLRRRLRKEVGFSSMEVPDDAKKAYAREMQNVLKVAFSFPENRSKSLSEILVDKDAQKLRNVVGRFKAFSARKTL